MICTNKPLMYGVPGNMTAKISHLLDRPAIRIDLHQAVCALAEALSLVGIDEHQHGERVACMAIQCATQLNWSQSDRDDLFHAGLLHDCGVSSSRVHRRLISEMDWEGAELHCVLGEYYLSNFPPLAHLGPVIRHHHTHWETLETLPLPPHTRLASNLLYLVDRVDAKLAGLRAEGILNPAQINAGIRESIEAHSGSHFAPELVEVFLNMAATDAFWLNLEPLNLTEVLHKMWGERESMLSGYEEIRKLSLIFAHIVDAKSDFTYDHSLGVAELARHLSQLLQLPEHRIAMIEIAALLHDLGKLGVPDEILEKSSALTSEETQIMHRHSYDTYRILRRIEGFEEIAEWAGNHHETLLGNGYPFQRDHTELSIEARIIMVADIFQALAQKRPYREALPAEEILAILKKMATDGKLDAELVQTVAANLSSCYASATEHRQGWHPNLCVNQVTSL